MTMRSTLLHHWHAWKQDGRLMIAALLLTELIAVLWLGFLALFALETLLPTFVTVRLSLTEYLTWLVLGTAGTLWLRQHAEVSAFELPSRFAQAFLASLTVGLALLIALSMARFPLIPGIAFFLGYALLAWLLWRSYQENR